LARRADVDDGLLREIGAEPIVFPPAPDLLEPFLRPASRASSNGEAPAPRA